MNTIPSGGKFFDTYEGLKAAKQLLMLMEDWQRSGLCELRGIAIRFGDVDVTFTPSEYIQLAQRAVDVGIQCSRPQNLADGNGGRN